MRWAPTVTALANSTFACRPARPAEGASPSGPTARSWSVKSTAIAFSDSMPRVDSSASSVDLGASRVGPSAPAGVAIYSSGQIYVADAGRSEIQVFGPNGVYQRTTGGPGTGPGPFSGPGQLSFDRAGDLWVPDYGNDRFEKFDPSGKFVESYAGDPTGGFAVRQPNFMLIDGRGRRFMVDTGGTRAATDS